MPNLPLRQAAVVLVASATLVAFAPEAWVSLGPDHKLHYRSDEHGNRIMDFSYAGYGGGGVSIPDVPAITRLKPAEGDNTTAIQLAINNAARRPLDAHGFRGAVELGSGMYPVNGTITIGASGVVLRGSGAGDGGTRIQLTGQPHRFLELHGAGIWKLDPTATALTDAYVPSGALSFHVADASAFHAGDAIAVRRPVTEAWIHFMGMDTLVRDGKPQTWLKAGVNVQTDRTITAVTGNQITLDAPLTDAIDGQFLGDTPATVAKYSFPGRISQVGMENLSVATPFTDVPITDAQFTALHLDAATDAWVRHVTIHETQNGIVIGPAAKRITFDDVRVIHSSPHSGTAAPADFAISGTQVLLSRCAVDGEGTWPGVTQSLVTGPNVVLDFTGTAHAGISPHQRWATGLLVDRLRLPNVVQRTPGIAFSNRKTDGSGQGWDVGWGVAWNVDAPFLLVQQPPGAMNWCIGCRGEQVKQPNIASGILEQMGHAVEPSSLYLEQLRERLGDSALANIGYANR